MRNLVFILCFIFSGSALASILDDLKKTPATKYEVGVVRLEVGAMMLSKNLEGKSAGEGGVKFKGARVDENPGSVEFVFMVESRAKDISEELCQVMKNKFDEQGVIEEMKKDVWPGLSDSQYAALGEEFFLTVELVSKENSAFTLSCK
ncbi:hypothetical protein [Marinobacter sp. DUT-1]|uniref:hypothetical protein n=1 Tax=Marinobacter sp. DUT-1 TaxID=3412037 RepID=UPI003D163C13